MASTQFFEQTGYASLRDFRYIIAAVSFLLMSFSTVFLVLLLRLASILGRTPPKGQQQSSFKRSTHLMIVLGSGGHTAEMLNILSSMPELGIKFAHRTYVVSSGDGFSALKAEEFEQNVVRSPEDGSYSIVTVSRARKVHQSFWTTPATALLSLWDCLQVVRGRHPDIRNRNVARPDLILTNGPATGVCVVVASIILLFCDWRGRPDDGQPGQGQMRTVFIESWARVKTLSLSGKILRPVVNRFLVQWPQLADPQRGMEYIGPLIS